MFAIFHLLFSFHRTTHTDRGLKLVETAFDKINGGRDGVKNVLIVMTDGKSHNQNLTKVRDHLNISLHPRGGGSLQV